MSDEPNYLHEVIRSAGPLTDEQRKQYGRLLIETKDDQPERVWSIALRVVDDLLARAEAENKARVEEICRGKFYNHRTGEIE